MLAIDWSEVLYKGEFLSWGNEDSLELLKRSLNIENAISWRSCKARSSLAEELRDAESVRVS